MHTNNNMKSLYSKTLNIGIIAYEDRCIHVMCYRSRGYRQCCHRNYIHDFPALFIAMASIVTLDLSLSALARYLPIIRGRLLR